MPLLRDAVAYYVRRGLKVRRALTHNSAVFRLRDVANARDEISILHEINRAQRRRTSS